jgi:hypothetical protein
MNFFFVPLFQVVNLAYSSLVQLRGQKCLLPSSDSIACDLFRIYDCARSFLLNTH